jgi:aspartate/glutamate racemase
MAATLGIIGGIAPASTVEYYLGLARPEHAGVPLLDTAQIHVRRALTALLD